jgi:hypothetical protein
MTTYWQQFFSSWTIRVALLQIVGGVALIAAAFAVPEPAGLPIGLGLILKSGIDIWARHHVDDPVETFLTDRTVQLALGQAIIASSLLTTWHDPLARNASVTLLAKTIWDIWRRYQTTAALADKAIPPPAPPRPPLESPPAPPPA